MIQATAHILQHKNYTIAIKTFAEDFHDKSLNAKIFPARSQMLHDQNVLIYLCEIAKFSQPTYEHPHIKTVQV